MVSSVDQYRKAKARPPPRERASRSRRAATAAPEVDRYGTYVESGESMRTSGEFLKIAGCTRKRLTPARERRASIVSTGTKPRGSAFHGGSGKEAVRAAGSPPNNRGPHPQPPRPG